MVQRLLVRGMIAGVLAAFLAVLFARIFGEPQVDLAIAFESAHEAMHGMAAEPELVSRATQRGIGLLTAVVMYGAAFGGLYSLVFSFSHGRVGRIAPRHLAMLLALGGFVAVALIPALKYPPTPPAVGQHETVAFRTIAYFELIGLSLVTLALAVNIGVKLRDRIGGLDAALAIGAIYIVIIFIVQAVLPDINEVPADYPAVVLWNFRVAAIGMQAVLWSALGLFFGMWADGLFRRQARAG